MRILRIDIEQTHIISIYIYIYYTCIVCLKDTDLKVGKKGKPKEKTAHKKVLPNFKSNPDVIPRPFDGVLP